MPRWSTGGAAGWTQRNHRPTGGGSIENIPTPWGKKKRVYWFCSAGYTER